MTDTEDKEKAEKLAANKKRVLILPDRQATKHDSLTNPHGEDTVICTRNMILTSLQSSLSS